MIKMLTLVAFGSKYNCKLFGVTVCGYLQTPLHVVLSGTIDSVKVKLLRPQWMQT